MTRGCWSAGIVLLVMPGCASYLGTGRDYAEQGKHEIAVYYLATHYRTEGSPEARRELVRGIENAVRSADADGETLAEQDRHAAALGAATRKEELVDFARNLGLGEFEAVESGKLVREALQRAARQALRVVDAAEEEGRSPREQTVLLRTALALDPHNPELAARYARTRSSLQLHLAPRMDCDARNQESCRLLLGLLMKRLTEERREFTQIVSADSKTCSAELKITVTVRPGDSGWGQTRSGKAKRKIEELDRFREPRRDAEGNKILREVRARYQVHERTTQATVTVELSIRDLRPKGGLLFDASKSLTETDRRTYVSWSGDERALGDLLRFGTDRTPPQEPETLARKAIQRLAETLAPDVIAKLEGTRE